MSVLDKTIDDLGRAFEEFKGSVDKRVDEIAKNGAPRADTEEKLAKINAEMDRLQDVIAEIEKKQNRPGRGELDEAKAEHRTAFNAFMRKGKEDNLNALEVKASLKTTVDADGGYAVPEEIDAAIHNEVQDISPIRQIAMVRSIGTSDYKKLVNLHGAASGWVGETAARTETNTPTLGEVIPTMGEIYANPAATQVMLDDVFFDAEGWLASEVATEFAQEEGAAFITGDGTTKPTGFLTGTPVTTGDDARAFGVLQYVKTGVAADFAATDPYTTLIDIAYTLKAGYRANARWVMNRSILGEVRKFKDSIGGLVWQPSLAAGQPSTILGYPITEAEDMPDKAANAFSIAFGDFRQGYLIVDRMGTRVLRDPYTNKPYVHFYTTKKVGGKILDDNAIKLLKFEL